MNYIYDPKKDITVYELAQITGALFNIKSISEGVAELKKDAIRHFIATDETIQRKSGTRILRPTR